METSAENSYLFYIVIAALIAIVLIIALLNSNKVKAMISKNKFTLNAERTGDDKDNTKVKNIKNNSDVDIKTKKDRGYDIDDVDNSKIKID